MASIIQEQKRTNECDHHQSPINIDLRQADYDPALKPVQFTHHPSDCLEIFNNGYTWSIRVKNDPQTKLQGTHLSSTYRLAEVHAHWGSEPNDGSEHVINKNAYAAEIHLVHYNEAYGPIEAAKKHGDGLAVLGILLQESPEDNPSLEQLLAALRKVPYKGETVQFSQGLDLAKIMPSNKDFCTYCGSLTTPPFTECVVWTVFVNPIPISRKQLDVFRSLNAQEKIQPNADSVKIMNNARSCQPLGNRKIKASFKP